MPPKTKSKGKDKKQKKGNEPKEKTSKAQPAKTDGDIKEKETAVLDSPVAAEKTKDELWEECVNLQEELKRVQTENNHFKTEMISAKRLWDNSKRRLEETEARMREKLRLKREAEKHYCAESEEHKLKLKQLRTAHHNELSELKMAMITTTSNTQEEHVESEVELQKKMYHIQADMGLKESSTEIYITKLQQKQQEDLRKLENSYGNQCKVIESKHRERMEDMIKHSRRTTSSELNKIDERMREHTASSLVVHEKEWGHIKHFFEFTIHQHLPAFEKATAETNFEAVKIEQKQLDSKLEAAVKRKNGLTDSLLEVKEKLSMNYKQKAIERKEMAISWTKSQKATARILDKRHDLYLKHSRLELSHEEVQQECKRLQERQTEAILSIQQKSNLKALMLENKINAMTDIQEKKQLKLWVALAFGQLDHAVDKKIKELFESKDATIKSLKNDISRDLEEYDDLVMRAKDLGITTDKSPQCCHFPVNDMTIDDLMKELTPLSISEHESDQNDAERLSLAAAEFRQ